MDGPTKFFFGFIFWGLAAPFMAVYYLIKGIIWLINRNGSEPTTAMPVSETREIPVHVSENNTLFGGAAPTPPESGFRAHVSVK